MTELEMRHAVYLHIEGSMQGMNEGYIKSLSGK